MTADTAVLGIDAHKDDRATEAAGDVVGANRRDTYSKHAQSDDQQYGRCGGQPPLPLMS
jgi:hypothetical protein